MIRTQVFAKLSSFFVTQLTDALEWRVGTQARNHAHTHIMWRHLRAAQITVDQVVLSEELGEVGR